MVNIIKSLDNSQEQIIKNILDLHSSNRIIDIDLTYSKGQFYKSGLVPQPVIKFDLEPQTVDTIKCSSESTPYMSSTMNTIMFDPPFVIAGKTYKDNVDGSSKNAKRFGAYENYEQLKNHYYNTLKECHRLLKDNGILIFKLQNTVSSGKQHWTHFFVMKSAMELGYYVKDEFVLHNKSKLTSFGGKWTTQQHAMKHHSYFLVLKKSSNKVNYNIQ